MEETFWVPNGYGDHRIVLMVKDPWWLHAYWKIHPDRERDVRSQLAPHELDGLQSVLRVYDVTHEESNSTPGCDVPLSGGASNWYLHVKTPDHSYVVEIGLLTRSGRFLPLARSNRVTTPRFSPSDVLDVEWMSTEEAYWRLFGVTAGIGKGSSPVQIKALLEKRLFSPGLFSPGLFSPMGASPMRLAKARAFWFWVNAELIVYGATDPKATVTIQGQPIPLRPDGTFSVRMALPDGVQTIPVQATSPDRVERRTITPVVSRETHEQNEVQEPDGSSAATEPAR